MLQFTIILITFLSFGVLLLAFQKMSVYIPLLSGEKVLNTVDQKIRLCFYYYPNHGSSDKSSSHERNWKSRYSEEDKETLRDYEKVIKIVRDFLKSFADRVSDFEKKIKDKKSEYLEKKESINKVKELSVLEEKEIKMLEATLKTFLDDEKNLEESKLLADDCVNHIKLSLENLNKLIQKLKNGES